MLSVQRMTPFFTSKEEFRLRLVFAYQYFSIIKGDELFHFIPTEGKEIVINMKSLQVENLGKCLYSNGEIVLFVYHSINYF